MAGPGVLQALRATVFAVVCVLLGAAGHSLASAALPPLLGLITGLPLIVALTGWLARRQRSLPTIAVAVTAAQLGLHALFDYAGAIPAVGAGHTHPAEMMTPAMIGGHLVAGLVAAWWLRRGEAAVWAYLHALAATLRLVLRYPQPVRVAAARPAPPRPRLTNLRPPAEPLRHSVVRRGPPRAA